MNTTNSSFSAQHMNSLFSDLFAQPDNEDFGCNWGFEVQNSKPKSSLPFSPSHFLSFFDSPIHASSSNIVPSSTNENSDGQTQTLMEGNKNYCDFSLPAQTRNSVEELLKRQQDEWKFEKPAEETDFISMTNVKPELVVVEKYSPELSTIKTNVQNNAAPTPSKKIDDGYNWRKYGQKQVTGSENSRGYFKCTMPNCPTKKKVETTLDGHIIEIVYNGNHSHPKRQSTKRSSSQSYQNPPTNSDISIQQLENGYIDCATIPENSSASFGENDTEQRLMSKSGEDNANEPDAKRWKGEYENEAISALGSQTVPEQRIVVQTTSDIDILDDGYRWRKYGQKVVKGNPNPRSYYKCTHQGCPVRKHVERASHDSREVITTYEGKHNHDVPAPRGSGIFHVSRLSSANTAANAPTAVRPTTNYTNPLQNTRAPIINGQSLQGQGSCDYQGF